MKHHLQILFTSRLCMLMLIPLLTFVQPPRSAAAVWILADDYSLSANPSGRWSFGSSLVPGQDFTLMPKAHPQPRQTSGGVCAGWGGTSESVGIDGAEILPFIHKCSGDPKKYTTILGMLSAPFPAIRVRNGSVFVHPDGIGSYAVIRWVAPKSADYSIFVSCYNVDLITGATTNLIVLRNAEKIAEGSVSGFQGMTYFSPPNSILPLKSGDVLEFAIGNGGNGFHSDSTGVDIVIRTLDPRL